jgi:hypothetical protein
MKLPMKLVCVLAVTALAVPASAEPKVDVGIIVLSPDNQYLDGNGSGWGEGEWIYYDQADWWNQWFYDDPPDPRRWKEISYEIRITPWSWPGPAEHVEIAINWSALEFPSTGPDGPPPMPDQEPVIRREVIFSGPVDRMTRVDGSFQVREYNPEWVSIDARTEPISGVNNIVVEGYISHECVPEPAAMALLAVGGLALRKRRRGP